MRDYDRYGGYPLQGHMPRPPRPPSQFEIARREALAASGSPEDRAVALQAARDAAAARHQATLDALLERTQGVRPCPVHLYVQIGDRRLCRRCGVEYVPPSYGPGPDTTR